MIICLINFFIVSSLLFFIILGLLLIILLILFVFLLVIYLVSLLLQIVFIECYCIWFACCIQIYCLELNVIAFSLCIILIKGLLLNNDYKLIISTTAVFMASAIKLMPSLNKILVSINSIKYYELPFKSTYILHDSIHIYLSYL